MRILGIAGSLRRDSHNRTLLRAAGALLPSGADLQVWDGLATLPAYDEDLEATPPSAVKRFLEQVDRADALLIATPEYNHSVPGALKNALDWASRPFPDNGLKGKPVLVVGASTGLFGAVWAQADTRKVLNALAAHVLEDELPVGMADEAFELDGALRDPELASRLEQIVENLVREVGSPIEQSA